MEPVRVLVAEDDQSQREKLVKSLREYPGVRVVGAAENGVEAVLLARDRTPEVIVCDMVMPQMDGFGVLRTINCMEPDRRPKVIALTALGRDDFITRAMGLGVAYYMVKPADIDLLVLQILQLAGRTPWDSQPWERGEETCEQAVARILLGMGIPVHLSGYRFLLRSALMVLECPDYLMGITRALYPAVARSFNTTASRVERSIRHAINMTWERGGTKTFERVLTWRAFSENDKPTNCELIALISERVRLSGLADRN